MLEELSLHQSELPPHFVPHQELLGANLKDLNLDTELFNTYRDAKRFLDGVKNDDKLPPNQVAQVFNTIGAILKEITKMQTDVYNAERVKKQELAMIHALKLAPVEIQDAFFEEFQRLIDE